MKILYINSLYTPHVGGGAEITLRTIVTSMRDRGHEVVVLATGPNVGLVEDQVDGVRVYRAEMKNLYWHYEKKRPGKVEKMIWHWRDSYNNRMRKYIRKIISVERPDIVNCHNLTGWSIAAWDEIRRAGIPIVQVLHDHYLICASSNMFRSGQACQRQCADCAMLRRRHQSSSGEISAVVGVSEYVLNSFIDRGYFKYAKKYSIRNSRPIPDSGERVTPDVDRPVVFGYLGTLTEHKGVDWLIEQFQKLDLPASLLIAGRGRPDYEAHLQRRAESAKVKFVGYVDSMDFLQQIDVCVVPSIWPEPLGMVAIEACAFHVPVIAAAVGGLREIVRHGVNGLLCNPEQPESLGHAMATVCNDRLLLKTMAAAARESVADMLDVTRMIDSYEFAMSEAIATQQSRCRT